MFFLCFRFFESFISNIIFFFWFGVCFCLHGCVWLVLVVMVGLFSFCFFCGEVSECDFGVLEGVLFGACL